MASEEKGFVAPYGVPWQTFLSFLEKLERDGTPTRIDRTVLSNMSGQGQSYMLSALRAFDLIERENGQVKDGLTVLTKDEASRKAKVKEILDIYYPGVVKLGQTQTTAGELAEAFTALGVTGESRRKAVTFFLQAAAYADVKVSPLWKAPRAPRSTGSSAAKKSPARKRKQRVDVPPPPPSTRQADGDRHEVDLRSGGGKVILTVSVNLFDLDTTDREFVLDLVDKMKGYGPKALLPASGSASSDVVTGETPTQKEKVDMRR